MHVNGWNPFVLCCTHPRRASLDPRVGLAFALVLLLALAAPRATAADQDKGAAARKLSELQARSSPEWLTRGVMYQILLNTFTPEGTLQAAAKRLPDVAKLGVTVVYLCPIAMQDTDPRPEFWSPRQQTYGLGSPRNPYRIKDYYKVEPTYGTDEDLREFVATAHKLGMRVILDLVFFHTGPTSDLLKHPEYYQHDPDGKVSTGQWNFPRLNLKNPQLREYLWKNMEYWVKDFNVDGYRLDVASLIPLDFWEEGRVRIDRIRPDLVMLAESDGVANQVKAFDVDYNYPWYHATLSITGKGQPASSLRKLWETQTKARPRGARCIRFTDNHDIFPTNTIYGERGEAAIAAVNFTIDGVPFLYNGQEIGDATPQNFYVNWPIRWEASLMPKAAAKLAFYRKLGQMRRAEAALGSGEVVWLDNDRPEDVISFLRQAGGERILTVANLSNRKVKVQIELPGEASAPARTLIADGAKFNASAGKATVEFDGFGYFVGKNQ